MEWLAPLLRNIVLSGQIRNEVRKGCFQWHTDSFRRATYQRFKAVLVVYHKSGTSLSRVKKAGAENR